MSVKVLVTGGAGYLGSTLVPHLLDKGHSVRVIDNLMYSQSSLNHVCHNDNFSFFWQDVRNDKQMSEHYKWADVIIPLAALVGAPICDRDPIGAQTINHDTPVKMFKMISKNQIVLMPTTNSAYGSGDANNHCDETSPLNPISLYAKQKVEVEHSLMERENSISFRLATVFGMSPRMRLDLLVNDFTFRAMRDKSLVLFESHFKRNYIHVRDIAKVFAFAIDNYDKMKSEIYNVGLTEANISKLELAQRIKEYIPKLEIIEAPLGEDPDKRNYIVSNAKIEAKGFKPSHSIDFGIKEIIKGLPFVNHSPFKNY